jgi:cyanophycinase
MSLTVLVGGGRDEAKVQGALVPFVQALGGGEVACVVADEGDGVDLDRWSGVLGDAASVRHLVVKDGRPLEAADLDGAAGVFVAGGLTPLYATLVVPARAALAPLPYAGFSAGSAIASERAVVGGWRLGDLEVGSEDASEDLDQLTVVEGLDRVPFAVDVHAAQWGTVTRSLHAVRVGMVAEAWAVDEHTALVVEDGRTRVVGSGAAHHLRADGDDVVVRSVVASAS